MTAEQNTTPTGDEYEEHPDVTAERIRRGGYNPEALRPGWAARQASQPDPHVIRAEPGE